MRCAFTCAAVRSPRSSQPSGPNWFVVSITILPSSGPAWASASSTSAHGTDSSTTSPKAAASAGVPALPPASAASSWSFSGSREKLNITS